MDFGAVLTWPNIQRLLFGNLFLGGEAGGLLLTLAVGALAILGSTILGMVIGLMRCSSSRWVRYPAQAYIQFLRSVPILILIFWIYFVPPQLLGIEISQFASATLALILFTAAYIGEIIRAGIEAVPVGQIEAGRVLGLSKLRIQYEIILPQAFYAMIPVIAGRYVVVIKNTSLAFLIGLSDLTEIGRQINGRLMTSPAAVYATVLVIYFVVNSQISRTMGLLEDKARFNRWFTKI